MTDEQFRTLIIYLRAIIVILGVITGCLALLLWVLLWLPA